MGGYTLERWLGVSGPVAMAMAMAGLIVGNNAVENAMSDLSQDYLLKFWSVIDDLLNAVLFLLIRLEVVAVSGDRALILLGAAAVPPVLMARAISVIVPLRLIRPLNDLGALAPATLVWGGLRGGISIALALGLPHGAPRDFALTATYVVVLFSVITHGGTIERLLRAGRKGSAL